MNIVCRCKNMSAKVFTCPSKLLPVQIRNVAFQKICLDSPTRKSDHHKPVGLYPCHRQGGNQVFCRFQYDLTRQYHFVRVFVQSVFSFTLHSMKSTIQARNILSTCTECLFSIYMTNIRYEIEHSDRDSVSMGSLKRTLETEYH